jgi:hypothetical protein
MMRGSDGAQFEIPPRRRGIPMIIWTANQGPEAGAQLSTQVAAQAEEAATFARVLEQLKPFFVRTQEASEVRA